MIRSLVLLPSILVLFATGCRGSGDSKANPAAAVDAAAAASGSGASASAELGPNTPANGTPLPAASVLGVVNPNNLPIYAGPTASIEGTITVTGDPPAKVDADFSRCPEAEAIYGKTFREGPALPDGSRPLADALIVITGYSGYIVAERRAKKQIAIDGCAYSTRTVDLTFGQLLDVQNRDTKMHAPELANHVMPALIVAPPGGDPVSVYPVAPGLTLLTDKMGPLWMVADVYTVPQPLHTVTDRNGHYRIDGIPTERADHTPIDGDLEMNVTLRVLPRYVKKPLPRLTPGVVERVDAQLENRPLPPAPDAGASAGAGSKKADAGKKPVERLH
ncbi:hypothetical protein [Pendulispora albinea]|uniref:Carboxypeptidase regulatory-like domain-containing protein n=1 Tax=Pendulispora albinea TaxID=2741071 RepID=A0ABZ2LPN1_9BACT